MPAILCAQNNSDRTMYHAIDRFVLGAPKSDYEPDIVLVKGGIFTWNNTTTYSYQYTPLAQQPCIIADVPFKSLLLVFNEKDTMLGFQFFTFYKNGLDAKHSAFFAGSLRKAKKDYKKLLHYFNDKWQQEGQKKVYYLSKQSEHSGYEWKHEGVLMKLGMQWSEVRGVESVSISISLTAK